MANKLKLSQRSRVRLTKDEINTLKSYVETEPAALANITNNTGVARTTVHRIIENGWAELKVAIPMRDFIKLIPKLVS